MPEKPSNPLNPIVFLDITIGNEKSKLKDKFNVDENLTKFIKIYSWPNCY
jgi:hypothetical protein